MQRATCTAFALVFLFSIPLTAQTIILEAEVGIQDLLYCQWVHIPVSCGKKHIQSVTPPVVGGILQLSGESYIVEWIGPGYHLASGLILQPAGATKRGLKGQRWLEVYPAQGRIHISRAWEDADGNRALSVSDTLTLRTSLPLEVKDVRLQLRVRPVPLLP